MAAAAATRSRSKRSHNRVRHKNANWGRPILNNQASSTSSSCLTSSDPQQQQQQQQRIHSNNISINNNNTSSSSSSSSGSAQTVWTDDRHSSYLNSIEEVFVRNLYDGEYCAPDICGEAAAPRQSQRVVELSTRFAKVLERGEWHPFPSRRLHAWELPAPVAARESKSCDSTGFDTDDAKEARVPVSRKLLRKRRLHGRPAAAAAATSAVNWRIRSSSRNRRCSGTDQVVPVGLVLVAQNKGDDGAAVKAD